MSENTTPRHAHKIGRRADYKIRIGFTEEEREDYIAYCTREGYSQAGLARRTLLKAIGRTPVDIDEAEL